VSAVVVESPRRQQPTASVALLRGLHLGIALTTFLGAYLLFQVQPLIGKAILPWFGGSPAVWTTAMVVFQMLLTAGYAFVDWTTRRLSPSVRSYVFLALALGSIATLPILPTTDWKPSADQDPTFGVLRLLTVFVGAPYFLLSMTGPLTQEWFTRSANGKSPYRLYALSNLGSLLGLFTYPLVVEPLFELPVQSRLWTCGFLAYCALAGWSAWKLRRYPDLASPSADRPADVPADDARPTARQIATWIALAAAGSAMLSATTNHLCQDVPTVPLLWIGPLAVYLISFIVCFSELGWYRVKWVAPITMALIPLSCVSSIPYASLRTLPAWLGGPLTTARNAPFALHLVVILAMLTFVCLAAHGELARRKPGPRRLTTYYLAISIGGAVGGLFVGVVAPFIYSRYWEWILGTSAAYVLCAVAILAAGGFRNRTAKAIFGGVALLGGLALAWLHAKQFNPYEIDAIRNFYGVVYVDAGRDDETGRPLWTAMRSGSTRHGVQILEPGRTRIPTAYYGTGSAVGIALQADRRPDAPRHVGIVGLGAGTLAAYGTPGDTYRFYEINPAVVAFADAYFTYLRESVARCEIVVGDARLSLEREPDQNFDLLVVDAFTGDAIPTHLLTAEAFEVYLRHLRADGILAIHISNQHLDLAPVLAAAAERFGLADLSGLNRPDPANLVETARWTLLTRRPDSTWWRSIARPGLAPAQGVRATTIWTDSYSNLIELLK